MKALVWNTRFRMERGVWVTDNGEIPSFGQGGGLFTFNTARVKDKGLSPQVDLGHVLQVLESPLRGFHDLLRQKPPSLLIL
jgi:hypothetical protein